jgi:PAS domain-containing protein
MEKFNNLSVKVKVPVMMGIASLAVFSLVCLLLLFPLRSISQKSATNSARLEAQLAGESLMVEIDRSVNALRAYSDVIAQLAETKSVAQQDKRELLLNQLSALGNTGNVLENLWVILEPNALDGLDSLYINRMGSNDKGVFTPWYAQGGELSNTSHKINTNLYRHPKETGYDYISEPYDDEINGRKVHIFSISVPVRLNGKFLGVLGTNYHVSDLNRQMASLLGNTSDGKMITDEGSIVVYQNTEEIGKIIDNGNRDVINRLAEGKMFEGMYENHGKEVYQIFVPIRFGNTKAPWFYAVDIPKENIYATTRQIINYLLLYCIMGVLLIAAAGWFLITPILKHVVDVTGNMRLIALGRINCLQFTAYKSKDEIGEMKNELHHVAEGLKMTSDFAHNIGEGNFDAEFTLNSDDDLLGNSLLEMRRSLREAAKEQSVRAKEEERRNWGTEGLAKFAEILRRDNNNLETLSYNIISSLVKYLGINQGAIFILNKSEGESGRALEMMACYAYDRRKYASKQIEPGEGLIGTCYLEGAPIDRTDGPDGYINLTSGLGEANPRAIYICPLQVNDVTFGVLELASFHDFEPHQLEFIRKLGESIAATISSVNVNIRTNQLLQQSKLQAEEMVNVEEELRQNIEEMQATQEEMRRRETELHETLSKMQEIRETSEEKEHEMDQFYQTIYEMNNIVEFSSEAVITSVNQNLLRLFGGADRSQFMGKPLSVFVGEEAYAASWECLKQGKPYEDVQTVTTSDGKTNVVRQKFIPICDKSGHLLRAFLLVFPER